MDLLNTSITNLDIKTFNDIIKNLTIDINDIEFNNIKLLKYICMNYRINKRNPFIYDQMIKILLKHGCKILNNELYYVACSGNIDAVKELILYNADINYYNDDISLINMLVLNCKDNKIIFVE